MTRRVRRLGFVQRDVLDSLRDGEHSVHDLVLVTGRRYDTIDRALLVLLAAGCVRRDGRRSLGRRGSVSWTWFITPRGRRELALRERAGVPVGAPWRSDVRLEAPWCP